MFGIVDKERAPIPHRTERGPRLVEAAMDHPKVVLWLAGLLTLLAAAGAVGVETDTDPENMLPADDPVRLRTEQLHEDFGSHDQLVVGIVDDEGVTTPEILGAVEDLGQTIVGLDGVVGGEVLSFATVLGDDLDLSTPDAVDEAVATVAADPLLGGTVISADGTTAAVFVPLEDKGDARSVADAIDTAIGTSPALAARSSYVAGLPLAEEAFGHQMFLQMAVFAPLAGLLIFALMWWFFRRLGLVLAAMATSMLSVVWTMGALIGSGNTLHIMSSMLPIFLMPIAILDSIHVLSEFFDRYPHHLDRRATLRVVYAELYRPLTFTSLTTGVAFASLALAPIPPVQVFGLFVAIGVLIAWILTLMLIPALVILADERRLASAAAARPESHDPMLNGLLRRIGPAAVRFRYALVATFIATAVVALPLLARVEVNDNPVNWFRPGSEVREATEALNERLPGTFAANLVMRAPDADALARPETLSVLDGLARHWEATGVVGDTTSYADLITPADPTADPTADPPADPTSDAVSQLEAAMENPLTAGLITPDRRQANVRLLLNDGDNQAMRAVVESTEAYLAVNPLPDGITVTWAGETYLNLTWQDEMVTGMLQAFASTLALVLVLMVVLFRSLRWALLSIVPVLWTVLVVYGFMGLVGKDYDMPIAVLSTLVLGIGVDFAIHFVERFRELDDAFGDRRAALRAYFEEPARALTRNALVIAVGFTPLLLASLTPYLVVGVFLSSIILLSWLATVLVLPAIVAGHDPLASEARTAAVPEPSGTERVGVS